MDMGFLRDFFRRDDDPETDDMREIREYQENVYNAGSGASESSEFLIEDVFVINGRGLVVTGHVVTGKFSVGDSVRFIHNVSTERPVTIRGIEKFRKVVDSAVEGEYVGMLLPELAKKDVSRNDMLKK